MVFVFRLLLAELRENACLAPNIETQFENTNTETLQSITIAYLAFERQS